MAVRVEEDGPVWTVVLDRPGARNAVDPATSEALHEAFLAFEHSDARAAVFWGAGGTFCAGWDLKHAASLLDDDGATGDAELDELAFGDEPDPLQRGPMGPSRMLLSKPVVAAIEGAAVAGGMELAMWADVRVMAETAFMGVYCRRWGISLIDGGTVRLPRLVGQGRALELSMTGRRVDAEECLRIGLCEQVVAEGSARAAAEELAHTAARFPQGALLADRRSILVNQGRPLADALRDEFEHGVGAVDTEGLAGAARFAGGVGRGGDFTQI